MIVGRGKRYRKPVGFGGDWRQAVVWLLARATRELTLFAAWGILLGGIDDLAVDLLWLGRAWWRRRVIFTRFERATMATLPPPAAPGRLAVFIPAWQESAVIGAMLRTALDRWQDADFQVFVGTYPNDPATTAAIRALGSARISIVPGDLPGPTSKAECLNRVWRAMLAEEASSGVGFKGIVLHDAEDVVHPSELALYDRMIERFDLVQIPVFPLPAHGFDIEARIVAGVYCDEFADGHARQLIVREALGASVPSAGVGCAVSRAMLGRVAMLRGGDPMEEGSLTEDYELGLRIAALGGHGAFVTIPATAGALPVCVRAHFPESVRLSVRQKARWVTGIALAGWDRLGWHGGLSERWMRFRDRRSLLAAIVLVACYAAFLLNVVYWPFGVAPPQPGIGLLLKINLALLLWRALMRGMIVARIYGPIAGVWAIPRMFVASLISIAAAARALHAYRPGAKPAWDKTAHVFPEELPCD